MPLINKTQLYFVGMVEKMAILRRSASKGISLRVAEDFSHYRETK